MNQPKHHDRNPNGLYVISTPNAFQCVLTVVDTKLPGGGPPRRPPNKEVRSREYLTLDEINALRAAARSTGRHTIRDEALIVVAYRHALRVNELVKLRWSDINFAERTIHINRSKREHEQVHCLADDEIELLQSLPVKHPEYVFVTELGERMSVRTAFDKVQRAGKIAGLTLSAHPHMLRHSRGFILANRGTDTRAIQDFMGHLDIRTTQGYTKLAAERMRGLESD